MNKPIGKIFLVNDYWMDGRGYKDFNEIPLEKQSEIMVNKINEIIERINETK